MQDLRSFFSPSFSGTLRFGRLRLWGFYGLGGLEGLGAPREVDKRLTLPTRTHIRFLVTGQVGTLNPKPKTLRP